MFAILAVLPLGLASLFSRRLPRSTAGFGFLAALAPFVAKGIGSLIGHKQKQSAEKQAEEARKLEAQRADELAKQQWEAQQNSPAAQAARYKNTLQLGRLAGAMGGLDKLPPSIRNYFQSQRTMPTYTGTSSYIATPKKGGGVWDFLGGVTEALPYIDTAAFSKPKSAVPAATGFGAGSEFGSELAGAAAAAPVSPLVTLTKRLKPGGLSNPEYPG